MINKAKTGDSRTTRKVNKTLHELTFQEMVRAYSSDSIVFIPSSLF
jgi:hypothetical protein